MKQNDETGKSKEGLSGISTKVDPAQREKDDCRTWLHETIEKLNQQNEQFEATIDQVNSGKKKKLSRADQGKFIHFRSNRGQPEVIKWSSGQNVLFRYGR